MYQIDNSSAAPLLPASSAPGTSGFFTDGNPATGTAPTILPAEFLNMLMLEVLGVLSAGGVTPSKSNFTQLTTAIRAVNKQSTILADTGTAGVYSAVNVPALTVLPASGFVQRVNIAHLNPGASTYAPDGLAPKPIYGLGLQGLQGGELPVGIAVLMYLVQASVNGGNGAWIIIESLGGAAQIAPATQSQHAVNAGQIQTQALTAFTTAGTAPAFTLTPVPAITLSSPTRLRASFNAAGTLGSNTLNVNGTGAKSLVQYDSNGVLQPANITSGMLTDVEYNGTSWVVLDPLPSDPWAAQPIGCPIPVFDNLAGASIPPTTGGYRYIKLTAADAYNTGVLTGESVSGSAPLVIASATISLAGSPMNGQVVSLINTEARVLRAGGAGALLQDALQDHTHGSSAQAAPNTQLITAGGIAVASAGTATGTVAGARVATETRAKSIGVTYFMRIK